MRLHRFYVEQPLGEEVFIERKDLVHQWSSVFRYTSGDRVLLFSLSTPSFDFEYQIAAISKTSVTLMLLSKTKNTVAKTSARLYMAIVKKDTFETIVRQATELMVTDIVPVIASRSEKKNLNFERLSLIAREAAEQCGRGDIPTIHAITAFKDASLSVDDSHVIFDKDGDRVISDSISSIWIGPEGGWTTEELSTLKGRGAKVVTLGESVLRADTAAIVGMSKTFLL